MGTYIKSLAIFLFFSISNCFMESQVGHKDWFKKNFGQIEEHIVINDKYVLLKTKK